MAMMSHINMQSFLYNSDSYFDHSMVPGVRVGIKYRFKVLHENICRKFNLKKISLQEGRITLNQFDIICEHYQVVRI